MLAVVQSLGSVLLSIVIKENSKPFWKYISSKKKDTQSIPPLDTKQGTKQQQKAM
jgi:hypothetical protein